MTDENGQTRIFIPSYLDDNRILCENDPAYVNRLKSIKDPALRAAWLQGDWDVYIGQAFQLTDAHIIKPIPVPKEAQIYMTFDWGYGKPFSIGWWWVDAEGRIYRFSEWYGTTGTPDEGLRITDPEIARGIVEREKDLGVWNRNSIIRLAGPDCWNKKPDYKGGGQGPATDETFARFSIYLSKGDPSREQKIKQFRERLVIPRDVAGNQIDRPMMQIYETCKHFLRTIPALSMDDKNPEDIDTEQEDHVYDESCHICMARPIPITLRPGEKLPADRHIDMITRPHAEADEWEHAAARDMREAERLLYYDERNDQGRAYSDIDGY